MNEVVKAAMMTYVQTVALSRQKNCASLSMLELFNVTKIFEVPTFTQYALVDR